MTGIEIAWFLFGTVVFTAVIGLLVTLMQEGFGK